MKVRLAAADAQVYWMSAKIPNDQFLLFAFDGAPQDLSQACAEVLDRARSCPDLMLRVDDGLGLTYPAWVRAEVDSDRLMLHGGVDGWHACLDAVARLALRQLDLRQTAWRLHVFSPVPRVPGSTVATVAVLQMGHALADGMRSSALAALLFGRSAAVPVAQPRRRESLVVRSVVAARTQRQLERDTAAGVVPPANALRPTLSINDRPGPDRTIRTVIRRRADLTGPTVTVAVLAGISTALADYLRARGGDPSTLGAEVPMAKPGVRLANNHFGNVGVGLHPDLPLPQRFERIAADLDDRRRRRSHPAFIAGDRAFAAVPAPLLRWGTKQFDANMRSPVVTGNTVVSSVNRGPADLSFGGRPVVLTAGYPALSPMMGVTHGIHGIGDTVAISVHAAAPALPDIDDYIDRLDAALG